MTAYPTTCLIDHEDGFRTMITLEEASDSYVEQRAMGVLVVSGESLAVCGGRLTVGLSPESLEVLERRCRELRGVPEDERPEPGTVVAFAFARIAELESQLTARRAHDADVRALARWAIETEHMSDHVNTDQIGDVGRRILAALDSHECPECHLDGGHKMSCSRGGSKGGRFVATLNSQGGEGE